MRRVVIDPERPDRRLLQQAGRLLRTGRLVAFPTETVYGLGANALDEAAVLRVFTAKGRAWDDPLIVHIADRRQLRSVVASVPVLAGDLMDRFWPGPLTLVLPRHPRVPPLVAAGRPTVAVRMPAHPVAHGLIRAAGIPVAAPSANRFQRPTATSADHVVADLGRSVDLVLDAGPSPGGIESTVVALENAVVRVLRPGAIDVETLRDALSRTDARLEIGGADRAAAPGQGDVHYAPHTPLWLVVGGAEALRAAVLARCGPGVRVGVLALESDAPPAGWPQNVVVESLGISTDPASAGRALFAALRRLDQSGCAVILARLWPDAAGLGFAINDRLRRAAAGTIATPAPDNRTPK